MIKNKKGMTGTQMLFAMVVLAICVMVVFFIIRVPREGTRSLGRFISCGDPDGLQRRCACLFNDYERDSNPTNDNVCPPDSTLNRERTKDCPLECSYATFETDVENKGDDEEGFCCIGANWNTFENT